MNTSKVIHHLLSSKKDSAFYSPNRNLQMVGDFFILISFSMHLKRNALIFIQLLHCLLNIF